MRRRVGLVHLGLSGNNSIALLGWAGIFACQRFAQSDSTLTWSGPARCQLLVQLQGFIHQEIQNWTLTGGAPTQEVAMQVYLATWSASGQGGEQQTQLAQVKAAQWKNHPRLVSRRTWISELSMSNE